MLRIHSTALKPHTTCGVFHSVSVVIASGKRPVPFRTRKLSLTAPMVLQPKGCGRVGHRRTQFRKGGPGPVETQSPGPGPPFRIPRTRSCRPPDHACRPPDHACAPPDHTRYAPNHTSDVCRHNFVGPEHAPHAIEEVTHVIRRTTRVIRRTTR